MQHRFKIQIWIQIWKVMTSKSDRLSEFEHARTLLSDCEPDSTSVPIHHPPLGRNPKHHLLLNISPFLIYAYPPSIVDYLTTHLLPYVLYKYMKVGRFYRNNYTQDDFAILLFLWSWETYLCMHFY